MFVLRLNKDNTPLLPIQSVKARNLIKKGKAFIYAQSPFVIKMRYYIPHSHNQKVIFYINIQDTLIELSVQDINGNIFFYEEVSYDNTLLDNKIDGLFYWIKKHIPITHTYLYLNDHLCFYFHNNEETQLLKTEVLLTDVRLNKSCVYCHRQFNLNQYHIRKIIKDASFFGNSVLVCESCLNRFNSNESNKYIEYIKNQYEILLVLKEIIKKYFYEHRQ